MAHASMPYLPLIGPPPLRIAVRQEHSGNFAEIASPTEYRRPAPATGTATNSLGWHGFRRDPGSDPRHRGTPLAPVVSAQARPESGRVLGDGFQASVFDVAHAGFAGHLPPDAGNLFSAPANGHQFRPASPTPFHVSFMPPCRRTNPVTPNITLNDRGLNPVCHIPAARWPRSCCWVCLVRLAAQPLNTPIRRRRPNDLAGATTRRSNLGSNADRLFRTALHQLERYDLFWPRRGISRTPAIRGSGKELTVKLLDGRRAGGRRDRRRCSKLAKAVRSENDLPRAQAIYTQYLQRWPGDMRTPEIYLHQGQVFREMGLPNMALAKFYGVMTTALSLNNNQLDYYKGWCCKRRWKSPKPII